MSRTNRMGPQGVKKIQKKRKRRYSFLRANYPIGSLVTYSYIGRVDICNVGKKIEHAIVLGYSVTKDPNDLPKLLIFNTEGIRSISPNGISFRGGHVKTLQRPYSKVKGIEPCMTR